MATKPNTNIPEMVSTLPEKPGVYQFFDIKGMILYVGKAKNLKKRVSSYFSNEKSVHSKVSILVSKIADLQYLVVDSESDALLLENNLIKKYQPRYNILLKDDKTFPWICIKNEPFPRVVSTRSYIKDGSTYFGPYTSVVLQRTLLQLIRELYPIRNCALDLSDSKISSGRYKPCLEYHLGNCKAPCIGRQTLSEYEEQIDQIKEIIKGNLHDIIRQLTHRMNQSVKHLKFEEAQLFKDKVNILTKYQVKSTIVNVNITNIDVFAALSDQGQWFFNYLRLINGAIVQTHTVEINNKLNEPPEEIISTVISEVRLRMMSNSKEIIVPFLPDMKLDHVKYSVPKNGDKFKLLELAERNLKYYVLEYRKRQSESTTLSKEFVLMEQMRIDLRMEVQPVHIECFDNSNLQGTNPVAACVVFRNGKPSKSEYRHFNVKTVSGPNDFASMKEIIWRRYRRMIDEGETLPQLIVIDGGKGQLSAAMESLDELSIESKVNVIGIAKRLEEIYYPGDSIPMYLNKKSETLQVIQRIRDEAHRFGITFHRNKRSSNSNSSILLNIKGLGAKSIEILYKEFKTIQSIQNANFDDLAALLGKSKAVLLKNHFENIKSEKAKV